MIRAIAISVVSLLLLAGQATREEEKTCEHGLVYMISVSWCGFCNQAREFMLEKNIVFKEFMVTA